MSSRHGRRGTILIADDHQMFAESLAETLGQHFTVVGQVSTLELVYPAVRRSRPDVVTLDLSFAGLSALPFLRAMSADRLVSARFVVLTGLEGSAIAKAAFEAGALAVLRKGAGVAELRLAIEVAMRGQRYSSGLEGEDPEGPDTVEPGVLVGGLLLTSRQVEVLSFALQGNSRREIAHQIGLTPKAVDYHLAELRKLLGFSTTRLVLAWAGDCRAELRAAQIAVRRAPGPSSS
jgi:two-component system, NarL family, nitrate/nitrite response regulator NarL